MNELKNDDKGYAPDNPSGEPWPCPLSSPDPVFAADGSLLECTTVTTTTTITEHPGTGMSDFAAGTLLPVGFALVLLGVAIKAAVTKPGWHR